MVTMGASNPVAARVKILLNLLNFCQRFQTPSGVNFDFLMTVALPIFEA
jgi:hypothetical protein